MKAKLARVWSGVRWRWERVWSGERWRWEIEGFGGFPVGIFGFWVRSGGFQVVVCGGRSDDLGGKRSRGRERLN